MKFILLTLSVLYIQFNGFSQMDTSYAVKINGINQHLWLKGEDIRKPVPLFLHGGPGRSVISSAESFNELLVKHFVVVHWDQREAGKTLALNSSEQPLSVELLQDDTHEMIQYLLRKFGRKKVFLVSHSWSSFLGFHIAKQYPDLLHAYIPISPIIDQEKHSRLTVTMLKEWAAKNNNQQALKELDQIQIPLQTKEDLFFQQKWLFIHNGVGFASKSDFRSVYFEWMDVWFPMLVKSFDINVPEIYSQLKCPVYFIEGNGDKQKSHWLVKEYFKQLEAETKKFYWFKKSGHTVFNTEPVKLQKTIIKIADQEI